MTTPYRLGAGFEDELLSTADHSLSLAIDLIGNEFANVIYGNAAAKLLFGGGGVDTMFGLGGNDRYVVTMPPTR